ASAKWSKDTDFRVSITNAPGKEAYPISSFTWLIIRPDVADPVKAKALKTFFEWMITPEAQAMAQKLQYAPLPAEVIKLIRTRLNTLTSGGKPIK
ncbi:MAG TPA: hypothetical protein VLC11_01990, partial [Gemmatimonadales bacterium]|nr:hypothetical protein [Gemmatimonadales bacterium]